MEYEREDDSLTFTRIVNSFRFQFRAERIRQERTGVHARLSLSLSGVELAWGYCNVDKDEERVRLSNSAYKMIAPEYRGNGLSEYPTEYLRKDLNDFCSGLWIAHVERTMPAPMSGAEERVGPSFQLKPFILDGGGTIIFGPPGRGKSYIMLILAICLDAGLVAPWDVPVAKRVLVINLERSAASLAQRIGNVNAALGLPRSRPLHVLNARGRSLEDVFPSIQRYVAKAGIESVFLDSLSRAGLGDMNANDAVNRIVDRLNSFATWTALGHTPRGDTTHIYGSQMFDAAADLTVRTNSEQEDDGPLGIGLELDKRNDVPWHKQDIIALEFDDLGLARVRPAKAGEFPAVEQSKKQTMRQAVSEFLLDCDGGVSDASTIADALDFNRSNVSAMLSRDKQQFTFVRRDGKKSLYGVAAHETQTSQAAPRLAFKDD